MRARHWFALLSLLSALCLIASPVRRVTAAEAAGAATAAAPPTTGGAAAKLAPPSVTAAAPATAAAPPGDEPVLWPEPQRAFFQDGPQLLLSEEQRSALIHMDVGARQRWIDEFLARSPGGDTPASTLKEGIARRQLMAASQYVSPADVRAQRARSPGGSSRLSPW